MRERFKLTKEAWLYLKNNLKADKKTGEINIAVILFAPIDLVVSFFVDLWYLVRRK